MDFQDDQAKMDKKVIASRKSSLKMLWWSLSTSTVQNTGNVYAVLSVIRRIVGKLELKFVTSTGGNVIKMSAVVCNGIILQSCCLIFCFGVCCYCYGTLVILFINSSSGKTTRGIKS